MKRRLISILMTFVMVLSLFQGTGIRIDAEGENPVAYRYPVYNETEGSAYENASSGIKVWKEDGSCTDYTEVTASSASAVTWTTGWYVVNGGTATDPLTIPGVTISGDVHLILTDGCNLSVTRADNSGNAGINVTGDNSLTIYAQSNGDNVGKLTAQGDTYADEGFCSGGAGIGGNMCQEGSNIFINGGNITATGGMYGAGIGGGDGYYEGSGDGRNIIINGGIVMAKGSDDGDYYGGAGIGGGGMGSCNNITINGGNVTATGAICGAGIGGGCSGSCSNITINGGNVTATGGDGGAGIGGGDCSEEGSGNVSNITINAGNVIAIGGSDAVGIGCGYGGTTSVDIYVSSKLVLKAGADADNAAVLENNGTDIASGLSDKQYVEILSVAKVEFGGETGVVYYGTLQKAIDAASADTEEAAKTVELIADVYLTETLNVASGKYVTLDLAGHVLSGKNIPAPSSVGDKASVIFNEGNLTITDSTGTTNTRYWEPDKNGLWKLQAAKPEGEEGVAYFTTTVGCITGGVGSQYGSSHPGGGVYNEGMLTINGGNIVGNTASTGGGVYNTGTLTINGGSIAGNYATANNYGGGGVYSKGTLTMYGGSITGNAAIQGGGVYDYNKGTLTMYGGSIAGNTAIQGGGIYLQGATSAIILGGTASVTGNTAVGLTSNIDMSVGTVSLSTETPLEKGASIGLTSRSGDKTLTVVPAAAKAFFSADMPNAELSYSDTEETLTLTHADESSKTYVVTNGNASGTGSLAQALYLAQTGAKITFAEGVTKVSCPVGQYPFLYRSITLDGGNGVTIASGFNLYSYLFKSILGAELTMSHLVLEGGYCSVSMSSEGTLKATDCTFCKTEYCALEVKARCIIENCRFLENAGYSTVALQKGAVASFRNCLLADNTTINGVLYVGHGPNGSATLTMDQCTMANNSGESPTGYLIQATGTNTQRSELTLNNCILANNSYIGSPSETVYELYAYSYSTITCNRVLGAESGWGKDDTDAILTIGTEANSTVPYDSTKPLFVDAANGDYHLKPNSQAKGKGNNALVPDDLTTDLDGNTRIFYSKVDLGCYEAQDIAAQVNSTNYPSLQEAIDAAAAVGTEQTPGEVKLLADVDLIETLTIADDTYVTLDLAGHVLSGKDIPTPSVKGDNASVIYNEGNLTITDSAGTTNTRYWVPDEDGLWQLKTSTPSGTEGTDYFTTTGGCITGGKGHKTGSQQAGIYGGGVDNDGTLNLNGGNIVGNTAFHGGGVYSQHSTLNLNGGNIVGNTAFHGGGVYKTGTLNLTGGNIVGNTAKKGGGVFNTGGTMKFSSGSISGNHAGSFGGGIFNDESGASVFIMTGGSITDNTITAASGTIYSDFGGAGIAQCDMMCIGGTAVIKDNKTNGVSDNLWCKKKTLTVTVDPDGNPIPSLASGAEIWINAGTSTGQITANGAATDAQYFHSDNLAYRVKLVKGDTTLENTDPLYNDHLELAKFDIATLTATTGGIIPADTAMTDTQAIAIMTDDATAHIDGIVVYAVSGGNYSYLVYDSAWSKAASTMTLSELKQEDKVYIIGEVTEKTELTLSATVADVNWTGEKVTDPTVTAKLDQTTKTDVSGYDFAYYDMENATSKLSENPSKAGYYKLVISIKDDDSNYYGTSEAYYFLIKPVINNVDGESGITTSTDYVKNEQVNLELHSSAELKDFIKVMVTKPGAKEAEEVPYAEGANYTVDDGGIKVTLTKAYLDTLESGTYVFHIISGIYTGTEWMKDVEQKTIEFSADITVEISDGCKYEACFAAGTNVTLLLGGKAAGKYTIAKVSNGYTIQAGTEYIALSADGKSIIRQAGSYTWKYDGGLYGEMKTTTTTKVLFWSRKSTKTTKVYLAMGTEDLTVSSKSIAAKLQVTGSHEWAYKDNNDGSTHKVYCSHCGKVKAEAEQHDYSYDETNHKCICGHVDPAFSGVKTVTVKETSKTSKSSGGNYFCGIGMYGWNSRSKKKNEKTTYTYTISTTQVNVKVKTIAYSLTEDGTMTQIKNNQFTSATKLSGFYIDVTDSNGVVTHWYYDGTKTTQLEEQRPQ